MKLIEKKKRIEEREEKIIAAGGSIRKSKISKKAEVDNTTTSTTTTVTPVKCFGTEILPDFEEGKKIEAEVTEEDCIWDRPIHYELQVGHNTTTTTSLQLQQYEGIDLIESDSEDKYKTAPNSV